MKPYSRTAIFLLCFGTISIAPILSIAQQKYWIEFRDKGIAPATFVPGDSLFEATRAYLSLPCLFRREHAMNTIQDSVISIEDAPISPMNLKVLKAMGIVVCNKSRWANAVSARLTPAQREQISSLPFIKRVSLIGLGHLASITKQVPVSKLEGKSFSDMPLSSDSGCGYDSVIYHYGTTGDSLPGVSNRSDLERINVWQLHAMGFDGSGIKLGHLDVGANLSVSSLKSANVLFQHDYVFNDSSVANPQDGHGTNTLSTAIGDLPDTLIGPAYHASVMVAHTENDTVEQNIEEDNYAAALDSMEARGVQITTSSLGYFAFDSGWHSYSYADMNGHTAICTKAVERAAKLGVLVVTAMGNGGDKPYPYVMAPADADSIIACGALDVDDTIASFSSRGPTSDGRIKPDICSPGVQIWCQNNDGTFGLPNGTSFATPLTSGACCLIMQAHPEATAQQIRQAVIATGDRSAHPDTAYGYGKLNAYEAALQLGTIIHPMHIWMDTALHVCAGIASKDKVQSAFLEYRGDVDQTLRYATFTLVADSLIYAASTNVSQMILSHIGPNIYYKIEVFDGAGHGAVNPRSGWNIIPNVIYDGVRTPTGDGVSVINAFPNPCSDNFTFSSERVGEWRMVTCTGSIVNRGTLKDPSTIQIATSSLANGTYYIEFISSSGETKTIPIVVIH